MSSQRGAVADAGRLAELWLAIPHGTATGARAHRRWRIKTCADCASAETAYRRRRRAERDGVVGPGQRRWTPQAAAQALARLDEMVSMVRVVPQPEPHGSEQGYRRHRARNEEPCEACREAARAQWKVRRDRRRATGKRRAMGAAARERRSVQQFGLCIYDWPDDPDRLCDDYAVGAHGMCAEHRA